jgi:hypothetical protein
MQAAMNWTKLKWLYLLQEERIFFPKYLRAALGPSLPRSEFGIRQFWNTLYIEQSSKFCDFYFINSINQ